MAALDRKRLRALEGQLGTRLPPDFLATLETLAPIDEGNVALVVQGVIYDIRTTYTVNGGAAGLQLDGLYHRVGDVLPPGALPIAQSWGGDIYCLMLRGPLVGKVVFWDHERDENDHHVEVIADSIHAFYAGLVPEPREQEN